ncbi:MAG: DUF4270 family protein [Saprospiraceae bacterium]|nr:DUF4270 family protein [Saprospiraceae bacterium]
MKQKLPVFTALTLLVAAIWSACTKPSPFGSELLLDELASYEFTDTLAVICSVEFEEDSLLTSDAGSTSSAFLCGELDDPFFGKSRSEIYTLVRPSLPYPNFRPGEQELDSVVLHIRYASANFYGDSLQAQTLRVFRLDEVLNSTGNYYAQSTIPATTEIGRVENFFPQPNTADSLFDASTRAPFLRVPLDLDFGKEIFNMDSTTIQNDSLFYQALRGLKITASSNATPGAMLAFNLNNITYSRLSLYYRNTGDTIVRRYDFFFAGTNKFTHFEHNYEGSPAGQQIGQESGEHLYLQAMQGLRVKVQFPTINQLGKIAVNKAQLVLTRASLPDDLSVLMPAEQLLLTENQGDTSFVLISDVLYSVGPAFNLGFDRFGGMPKKENINGTLVERYRLTLSDRLQDMVNDASGDINKKTLYLNITPQGRVAQRVVLRGPKNAELPAKLELKYTRVQ